MLASKAKCSDVRMVASSTMDHRPQSLENRCPQTTWSVTPKRAKVCSVRKMPSSSMTGFPVGKESILFLASPETMPSRPSNTLSVHEPRSRTSTRTTPRNLLLQSSISAGVIPRTHPVYLRRTPPLNCKYKTSCMVHEPYWSKRGCPHALGTTLHPTTALGPTSLSMEIANPPMNFASHKEENSNMSFTPSDA